MSFGGYRAVPLRIEIHMEPGNPALQLRKEQDYFAALTADSERLCVWQPQLALIVTAAESKLATFDAAVTRAQSRGVAVHVRRSGGGAVCLGPGTLVVSHLYRTQNNDLHASYRDFARDIIAAVADCGVSLDAAEIAGAYCNGRFDLACRGLKVGGIAQRRSLHLGLTHVWMHGMLAVARESQRYPQLVADFYADLESSRMADPGRTTTLSHCLAANADPRELQLQISRAVVKQFNDRPRAALP